MCNPQLLKFVTFLCAFVENTIKCFAATSTGYAVQNVQKSKPRTIREKRTYFTKIAALPLAWYRNLPYPYGRDVTSTGPPRSLTKRAFANTSEPMLLELYKKHSPKYCTVRAYIENSFRALSRPPPAGFALMLGILDLNYLLFLIILLLSSTMLVLQRCI